MIEIDAQDHQNIILLFVIIFLLYHFGKEENLALSYKVSQPL